MTKILAARVNARNAPETGDSTILFGTISAHRARVFF
jgi:hypothetical protein